MLLRLNILSAVILKSIFTIAQLKINDIRNIFLSLETCCYHSCVNVRTDYDIMFGRNSVLCQKACIHIVQTVFCLNSHAADDSRFLRLFHDKTSQGECVLNIWYFASERKKRISAFRCPNRILFVIFKIWRNNYHTTTVRWKIVSNSLRSDFQSFFVVLWLEKTLNLVVYMKGSRNCKYWLRKLINNSPKVFGRLILICLDFSYFYFRLRR